MTTPKHNPIVSPFHHHPRGPMSRQRRARIFALREGRCGNPELGENDWGCGRKLRPPADSWWVEHSHAFECGGDDDDKNCFVICEGCKIIKDGDDHALAAKGRERYTNHVVPKDQKKWGWGRR